jgi:hypothetical protein
MNALQRSLATFAVVPLAAALVAPAEAQRTPTIPEIRVGATVQGSVAASDPSFTDSGPFKVYRFQARAGERYGADMRSEHFDAFLSLVRPVGGITEVLRTDDDGGEGTDARLRFRVPSTGTYYLVAQSLMEDGAGPFSLSLQQLPAPAQPVARPIAVGQTVRDQIVDGDPIVDEDDDWEVLHHLYSVQGRAGQQLLVTMDSDDFDAYLAFGPLSGGAVEVTDVDDDGGEGTNARLRVTLPRDGTYGIQARTFGPGSTGAYTLAVREHVTPPVTARPITAGREASGALTAQDPDLENGAYFQHWTYAGRAGETLRVRMRSDEFDTYLWLGRIAGGTFEELAYNDDAQDDGTNSYLEFTLPATGEYVIRATSYGPQSTGAYTLRVDR